jgi:CubicO group peptidase (beta-lactamase class C family)
MKILTSTLLLVLSSSLAFGQLETKIDSLFAEYSNSPGCAIGVYSKGKILLKKGYGIANLDYNIEITPETVFEIGSVSKQFTAACIVLLENEGKLSLDDDIRKYIPEMPKFDEGKITIRNLLHHTSGLRDYLFLMYVSGISYDDYFTEQIGLDILIRQKELNFIPGSKFSYTNSGYLALAIIVRRVSGKSIGTFAQKNIFDPLEMKNTFIYEDGSKIVKNRAIGYSKEGEGYKINHHFDFTVGGDGQVYTTVEDFFKWSENFKSNKLGNDSFLNQMLTKGILSNGDTLGYALGLFHGVYRNHKTIKHGGSWGGFRAYYLQFPEDDLAITFMSNFGDVNPEQKAKQIADLVLKESFTNDEVENQDKKNYNQQQSVHLKTNQLEKFIGNYWSETYSFSRKIYVKNDTLRYYRSKTNENDLVPIRKNEFKMINVGGGVIVKFEVNGQGESTMTYIENGEESTIFNEYKPKVCTKTELTNFAGKYYINELDINYSLKLEDDLLMLYLNETKISPLKSIMMNLFTNDEFGTFKFKTDGNGKVYGFRLAAGSVENLWFEKK